MDPAASDTSAAAATAPTRPERMGRLPYTKLLFGSGTGWALDAMDVG